MITRKWQFR
jgi:hypothetical protein